nr:MAG TPA: hypothetical protein [Caudoviricetes sp.]
MASVALKCYFHNLTRHYVVLASLSENTSLSTL